MQRTYPPHSRHYHGPAAPKARRAWLWIVLLTPVAIIGTIGFVLSLGVLFNMTGEELELTAPERELVLDITHLSMWLGEYAPDAAAETVTKTRYIDDSYEIEYVYDVPEGDAAPYLTLYSRLRAEYERRDDHVSLLLGRDQGRLLRIRRRRHLGGREERALRMGRRIQIPHPRSGGGAFSATCSSRKRAKTVVYLLVSGLHFDDTETVSALLSPLLQKLDQYTPET